MGLGLGIDDILNLHNMIVQQIIGENSTVSTNIPYISLPVRPLYICKIEEVGSDLYEWVSTVRRGGVLRGDGEAGDQWNPWVAGWPQCCGAHW